MIWINDRLIENKRFPNNELLMDTDTIMNAIKNSLANDVYITFKYETDSDLMELFFITKYLKDKLNTNRMFHLDILYMPYSRMDRIKNLADAFTLRYVTDLINTLGFDEIMIMEAHSDVCVALLNAHNIPWVAAMVEELYDGMGIKEGDFLFFPDSSATKKYEHLCMELHLPHMSGLKVRNWETGKVSNYEVIFSKELKLDTTKKVFIVDDLCSKGTTAYHAGLALEELGFRDISLIVAHCENSIFDGKLLLDESPLKFIYTTDSILTKRHPKIKVVGKYVQRK